MDFTTLILELPVSYPLDWKILSLLGRFFVSYYEGLERLPRQNPYIFAANHIGLIDSPLIVSVLMKRLNHRVHFLAKEELFSRYGRYLTSFMRMIRVPNDKPASCLTEAVSWLKKGESVALFPEGQRNPSPVLSRGRTGVARLALMAKKAVVPVGYQGPTPFSATEDDVWQDIKAYFKKRQPVRIIIGQPLTFEQYYHQPITRRLLYYITDQIMQAIAELCGKQYNISR